MQSMLIAPFTFPASQFPNPWLSMPSLPLLRFYKGLPSLWFLVLEQSSEERYAGSVLRIIVKTDTRCRLVLPSLGVPEYKLEPARPGIIVSCPHTGRPNGQKPRIADSNHSLSLHRVLWDLGVIVIFSIVVRRIHCTECGMIAAQCCKKKQT